MGQKVHPTGIRLGIVKKHSSTWYAGNKDYAEKLNQDLAVRAFIKKKLAPCVSEPCRHRAPFG